MSEEAVLERRIRIKKKKMCNTTAELSTQQEQVVEELLCGLRSTFDSTFSRFTGFRVCDLAHGLNIGHCSRYCLNYHYFFTSPWTEMCWRRTSSPDPRPAAWWRAGVQLKYMEMILQSPLTLALFPPPPPCLSLPLPPALSSPVPLKKVRTTLETRTAAFTLTSRIWLTSQPTWSRTSSAFPKAFRTSGKQVHVQIKINEFTRTVFQHLEPEIIKKLWCIEK